LLWFRWKKSGLSPEVRNNLKQLERRIGYKFRRPALLVTALKHRSYLDQSGESRSRSNERLEFLGDAVLSLAVSEHSYHTQRSEDEGAMTSVKSTVVSGSVLAEQARNIDLGKYLFLSENEARSGGRDRDSILEDAFEALIGAIFLDGGLPPARKFVSHHLLASLQDILKESSFKNYKSTLQEYAQGRGIEPPLYRVVEENGPDHDKLFVVEVHLNGQNVGTGRGRSKKEAEQQAAAEGLKTTRTNEEPLKED
jgi:ribonuclease-3